MCAADCLQTNSLRHDVNNFNMIHFLYPNINKIKGNTARTVQYIQYSTYSTVQHVQCSRNVRTSQASMAEESTSSAPSDASRAIVEGPENDN